MVGQPFYYITGQLSAPQRFETSSRETPATELLRNHHQHHHQERGYAIYSKMGEWMRLHHISFLINSYTPPIIIIVIIIIINTEHRPDSRGHGWVVIPVHKSKSMCECYVVHEGLLADNLHNEDLEAPLLVPWV